MTGVVMHHNSLLEFTDQIRVAEAVIMNTVMVTRHCHDSFVALYEVCHGVLMAVLCHGCGGGFK